MSSPPEQQTNPPSLPTVNLQPGPDSELEQLLAQWQDRKAKADREAKEVEAMGKRIKLLLAQWANLGGQPAEVVVSSPVLTGPLRYHPKPRTKWDHPGLEASYPAIAEQFSRVDQVWYLDRL